MNPIRWVSDVTVRTPTRCAPVPFRMSSRRSVKVGGNGDMQQGSARRAVASFKGPFAARVSAFVQ
eukprot:6025255-Pyramimonas_sp.AAC.1